MTTQYRSVNCLGRQLENRDACDFEQAALRHQIGFSYEELGDQFDEDFENFTGYLSPETRELMGDTYFIRKIESINLCLQQIYLGNCSKDKCSGYESVKELIEEVQVTVNQD